SGATFDPPLAPPGYLRMLAPERRPHRAKDGYIAILPYMTAHWVRFFRHIGREDLALDETVLDPQKRSHAIGRLYAVIAEAAPAKTRAEWFAELKALEIPCMPVNSLEDLLGNEHLNAVGMFKRVEHPSEGRLVSVDFPVRFSGAEALPDRPAPSLGQDNAEVLGKTEKMTPHAAPRAGAAQKEEDKLI
ncbi:MAG TPA: CoA transferase, partial [Thermoanaerobaculia bacterium]|nr:CoA transferase [Thermoanaerobaculia bacterium]